MLKACWVNVNHNGRLYGNNLEMSGSRAAGPGLWVVLVLWMCFFSSVCGQRLYCDWAVGLSQYQNFNFRMKLKGAVCTF